MNSEILSRLHDIFRDILDDTELVLQPETSAADVEAWDSLAHLILVDAIENDFQIKFALGELQNLRNIGDMILLIVDKTSPE